jgi:hypothetical protein
VTKSSFEEFTDEFITAYREQGSLSKMQDSSFATTVEPTFHKLGAPIQMDKCGVKNGLYQLRGSCLNALNRGKIPKFSAMNAVNVTMRQDYPPEL